MIIMADAVVGDLVYVIPLDDGSGSWVLMSDEYEGVQVCEMPATVAEETEPASKAPAAVVASGLGLMLLAGLL